MGNKDPSLADMAAFYIGTSYLAFTDLRMNTEFENEYYVPKTYAETAMEVIKNDWEDRKSKDCKKYTQEINAITQGSIDYAKQ